LPHRRSVKSSPPPARSSSLPGGASAESGITTFCDALTGPWARYDPLRLATAEAFARDQALAARWYDERSMLSDLLRAPLIGCARPRG
jgi:hypothetical protein